MQPELDRVTHPVLVLILVLVTDGENRVQYRHTTGRSRVRTGVHAQLLAHPSSQLERFRHATLRKRLPRALLKLELQLEELLLA